MCLNVQPLADSWTNPHGFVSSCGGYLLFVLTVFVLLWFGVCDQSRVDKMRQKALQQKLRSGLMSLPEPQYTYEIEVPEVRYHTDSTTVVACSVYTSSRNHGWGS